MNAPLKLSHVVEGYLIAAQARKLSWHTLSDYGNTFKRLHAFLGDPAFDSITVDQLRRFLASWSELSEKTLLNYHTGLSALWQWASTENIVAENIVRRVRPPDPPERAIMPFSEEDLRALLAAIDRGKRYARPGQQTCSNRLNTAPRNRAIILLLLDTGLRASELIGIKLRDLDQKNRHIRVIGKGNKERYVPFSPPTGQAIWRYLASRSDTQTPDAPLFIRHGDHAMTRSTLQHILLRIAERAGVPDVHPHRFRHTFSIMYLRRGGNIYTLQRILGHSSLTMCLRYLAIAQSDIDAVHINASPVVGLRL